ncbi:MAG: hypothetical protein KIT69_03880 [Propionibacteriaceae bacterium]|nr:hypothetical protein [Propionibacteriaceae bacterium]
MTTPPPAQRGAPPTPPPAEPISRQKAAMNAFCLGWLGVRNFQLEPVT